VASLVVETTLFYLCGTSIGMLAYTKIPRNREYIYSRLDRDIFLETGLASNKQAVSINYNTTVYMFS